MSSRELTSDVTAEIAKTVVQPIVLVEMAFDSGTLRMWSGGGDLYWNSLTWLGAGELGSVSEIKETEDVQANGITLSLTGIPSEYISLALSESYQGRTVTVWLGFLDSALEVISDPKQIFSGRMDVMEISEGAETSSISIAVESRMIDLLKSREWRYTHEDQQIDYPGDMGLEFVSDLQNKEIKWVAS